MRRPDGSQGDGRGAAAASVHDSEDLDLHQQVRRFAQERSRGKGSWRRYVIRCVRCGFENRAAVRFCASRRTERE